MTPIPQHQLCTDCQTEKRALAMGLTGYGCLCIPCYEKRMEDAKKHKPRRPPKGKTKDPLMDWKVRVEMMNWTQEQKCVAGYCLGCEFCDGGRADRPLDNLEDL
jgi:hypothetical protein